MIVLWERTFESPHPLSRRALLGLPAAELPRDLLLKCRLIDSVPEAESGVACEVIAALHQLVGQRPRGVLQSPLKRRIPQIQCNFQARLCLGLRICILPHSSSPL